MAGSPKRHIQRENVTIPTLTKPGGFRDFGPFALACKWCRYFAFA